MKSSNEPAQRQKPLDPPSREIPSKPDPAETWRPYGPNPEIEINNLGKLRTKPLKVKP